MDDKTLQYYEEFAEEIADRYDNRQGGIESLFPSAFSPGMRVLDVGAGSGHDMRSLLELGVDAYGVEPSAALREIAQRRHPVLVGRLQGGELPDLDQPFGGQFDGVLCSAVLMHLPLDTVFDAAIALRGVLRENGRLLLSIPASRPSVGEDDRDSHGRLFTPLNEDYLELLFERLGFQLVGRWHTEDVHGRKGITWCSLLFCLRASQVARPIDDIAGVLTRDKKFATYKLALFRALADVATTGFEQARWTQPGVVAVPVDTICEKWLLYYWPLFESRQFIPQLRGESATSQKQVLFRQSVAVLIDHYAKAGGLAAFVLDWRNKRLTEQGQALLKRALGRIRDAIVAGPVIYAGGSLETGRLFSYNTGSQEIEMPSEIWRELSLLGHWIQDAVVLRWAELTSEISRGRIKPSEVIDLLLVAPLTQRDVAEARAVYRLLPARECAWTGQPILAKFEVDHIIPFSLWRNNDLWNLLPVLPQVNSRKGDRLPTRELMVRRRDYVLYCWESLHQARGPRFEHELCRLIGADAFPLNWQAPAFRCTLDAVEITALQRGSERWQP